MLTNESDVKAYFGDNLYKNYIKIFLINRKEENNEDGLWQEWENMMHNFKSFQHCRTYDSSSFNASSIEQIPNRLKN